MLPRGCLFKKAVTLNMEDMLLVLCLSITEHFLAAESRHFWKWPFWNGSGGEISEHFLETPTEFVCLLFSAFKSRHWKADMNEIFIMYCIDRLTGLASVLSRFQRNKSAASVGKLLFTPWGKVLLCSQLEATTTTSTTTSAKDRLHSSSLWLRSCPSRRAAAWAALLRHQIAIMWYKTFGSTAL